MKQTDWDVQAIRYQRAMEMKSNEFILRPYHEDGSLCDPHAIAALRLYAAQIRNAGREEEADKINDWLDTAPTRSKK